MIIIVNRIVLSDGRDILIIRILNSDKPRLGANTCAKHVTFITRNFRLHRVNGDNANCMWIYVRVLCKIF